MNEREQRLRREFGEAGQDHVFRFFDELDAPTRERFLTELEGIDLPLLGRLIEELETDEPVATLDLEQLEPPAVISLPAGPQEHAAEVDSGEELLRQGKVAAFVVAGGQGTRLGFDGPKGCFPVGPVSGCSLFEWHFSKVVATRRRYGAPIPMLVMTSAANHEQTEEFLCRHDFFGVPEEDVLLFRQGMLPAVDPSGRLLLATKSGLSLAPDGHGGSLAALHREGVIAELDARGVEELFYFQVDNPLVKILDPAFLGHHRRAASQMSSKVCVKRDASEKVGVFACAEGKTGIVEYSDLPESLAAAVDAEGRLLFGAGNIAIHMISLSFVKELTAGGSLRLPYHRARKAVECVGESGEVAAAGSDKNGVKFETFVFDALPLAEQTIIVEADRKTEFSPVKNKSGEDSADSARRDLIVMFRSWLESAGFKVDEEAALEIAPTFALDETELVRRVRHETRLCADRALLA